MSTTEGYGFDALIEALQIFRKYAPTTKWPTHCEHDVLIIYGVEPTKVSPEDHKRLEFLGFHVTDEYGEPGNYQSFRFGSC